MSKKSKKPLAQQTKKRDFKTCQRSNEIRLLRKDLPLEQRLWLVGGKFDRLRVRQPKQINIGLFGEPVTQKALTGIDKKPKENLGNMNLDVL